MTKTQLLYQGSVKDLLGPVSHEKGPSLIFRYSDAYSVFDWGRMPDSLKNKGRALAVMAGHWFEKIESAKSWQEFSKTPEALKLRKANRFGAEFNEIGETLQREGLATHYIGVVADPERPKPVKLAESREAPQGMQVRQVSVVKPAFGKVLGVSVADYEKTRAAPAPKLAPLEVVFRFSCPPGSSLLGRMRRDPDYLASRGYADVRVQGGENWEFPVLELFSKLEKQDRPVTFNEALSISGMSAQALQKILFKTAWVAGFLKADLLKSGLELADGKLEWGLDERGECFLVDAVGPDELRILHGSVQLSKEFLRDYYRDTPWYRSVIAAKEQPGVGDWKQLIAQGPENLSRDYLELATHLYPALANAVTRRKWFAEAWPLERVITRLTEISEEQRR